MAVIITAEDYADLVTNMLTRHASDADKQAFFDAFLNVNNALTAKILERFNIEWTALGYAPAATIDDVFYHLTRIRGAVLDVYNNLFTVLNALAGSGAGNIGQLTDAMTAYTAARVAAEAGAITTAGTNLINAVNAVTGGAAATVDAAMAALSTFVINSANGADGVADAAARFNADFAAEKTATYDPLIAKIVELGDSLTEDQKTEVGYQKTTVEGLVTALKVGETTVSVTQENLENQYSSRSNTTIETLNTFVATLQVFIGLPTSDVGVSTIII